MPISYENHVALIVGYVSHSSVTVDSHVSGIKEYNHRTQLFVLSNSTLHQITVTSGGRRASLVVRRPIRNMQQ